MAKLLIVESPGKIKTLRKILGSGWILEASIGHTTELAHDGPGKLGFEFKQEKVEARYIPRGDRGKQVLAKLRAAIKQADHVYLAMDPDREGEAIAWHLVEQLKPKNFSRISYSQITESAVKAALKSPRGLDFPLIHAQQARQCLDKLVGFEVSPLLWNTSGGKSAGRVQSAALHLLCEREHERLNFIPETYWTLHSRYAEKNESDPRELIAQFELKRAKPDSARALTDAQELKNDGTKVMSSEEAERIKRVASTHSHVVTALGNREERKYPLPPLITSTLQQTASVRLKFSPQKTMKVAQELYEGINGKGLITYMRTDSVSLSSEFVTETQAWLKQNRPEALSEKPPQFKVAKDAQGAHEAIRPTSVALTPKSAAQILNCDQHSLYKLIWERAVASQCKFALLSRTQVEITAADTRWVARGLRIKDEGYLRFWQNIEEERQLPNLEIGQKLTLNEIKVEKKATQAPSRYSEAKLVQLMEKLGIGRPSTFASTVATLRERNYAQLEKEALAPTQLGLETDKVLVAAMPELVDVKFTAKMEESLDKIADAKLGWEKFLIEWNESYFKAAMQTARNILKSLPVTKFAGSPFSTFKKAAKPGGDSRTKPFARKRKSPVKKQTVRGAKKSASSATAPACEAGHGAMSSLVSKKGDPYWKCEIPGCKSWKWNGRAK